MLGLEEVEVNDGHESQARRLEKTFPNHYPKFSTL
jgi:hypothetical protein